MGLTSKADLWNIFLFLFSTEGSPWSVIKEMFFTDQSLSLFYFLAPYEKPRMGKWTGCCRSQSHFWQIWVLLVFPYIISYSTKNFILLETMADRWNDGFRSFSSHSKW